MKYLVCYMGFAVIMILSITVESRSPMKKDEEPTEAVGNLPQRNPFGSSISEFSYDFLRVLQKSKSSDEGLNENLVFSPSSIFRAFLLLSLGTKGNTGAQLNNALRLRNVQKVNEDYQTWRGLQVSGVLEADRLYHDISVEMKQEIKTLLTDDIHEVKMDDASTIKEVNQWVSNMTQKNIPELLSGNLENVKLLLLSVVYMRGEWQDIFDEESTRKYDFHAKDNTKQVNMMYLNTVLSYVESSNLESQVLSLPYKDSPLSFLVFLPNAGQTVEGLISSLSSDNIKQTVDSMTISDVEVRLPKFKIEKEIDLIPMLKELGVQEVFTRQADMSGFTNEDLYVNKALQKVILEVDEKGTTAAATTAIHAVFASLRYPKKFTADHPFVFMIYDRVSAVPLFVGVMMDPTM